MRKRRGPLRGVGDADEREQVDGATVRGVLADRCVDPDGLRDLIAARIDRRQRGKRILEDHRDPAAADRRQFRVRSAEQFVTLKAHRAADACMSRQQVHNGQRRHRLSGTRLADDAQHLPGLHVVGQRSDGGDGAVLAAEGDGQIRHRQQRRDGRARGAVCVAAEGRSWVSGRAHHDVRISAFGSKASRSPSPTTLMASTSATRSPAGK